MMRSSEEMILSSITVPFYDSMLMFHEGVEFSNPDYNLVCLTYFLGAYDEICQRLQYDLERTLNEYEKFLVSVLKVKKRKAGLIINEIVEFSLSEKGHDIMSKGGEDYKLFREGIASAPGRLTSILVELERNL